MPPTTPLIATLLAGGQSSRMGTDKSELLIRGQPLLQTATRLLLSVCPTCLVVGRPRPAWWPADLDPVTFLPDNVPSVPSDPVPSPFQAMPLGPLAGVFTALTHTHAPILVLPVDMPAVPASLLQSLADRHHKNPTAPLIMTRWTDPHGHPQYEPLLAIYTPAILPVLVEKLKSEERSLWSLAQTPRALFWNVPPEEVPQLINLNDPATLQSYLESHT